MFEAIGPLLNRGPDLDNMPFDLPLEGIPRFEHLAGLFSSTQFDHGVISMTIRQAAYLFGLIRHMNARRVIEIGRYKGGSAVLIAAAMEGKGDFWSIDIGEKEARLYSPGEKRTFDDMLDDMCTRLGLKVHVIVGDSSTLEVDTGPVDLVFIDGDHSYEGAKIDFEHFGKRVRVGGAVLFDDAFDDGLFKSDSDAIGRVVEEILAEGEFKQVKVVNRMAHLERVKPPIG